MSQFGDGGVFIKFPNLGIKVSVQSLNHLNVWVQGRNNYCKPLYTPAEISFPTVLE
jgi:hypothetical protein